MKKIKWIVTTGVCVLAGAGIQYLRRFWKKIRASETPEEMALREWSELLTADAGVYTGMFSSLKRVVEGKAKKPEKVLREWCARTSYKWPEGKAAQLCQEYLMPAAEAADVENCAKWAKILLDAAQNAGITPRAEQELTLDDTTVRAYSEWDGQELYCDSRVKIIVPAWYQNGTVIEQGMASLL